MMRWPKVRTIAGFEMVSTLRRPAYLITTFGMPVFLLLYAGFGLFVVQAIQKAEKKTKKIYGVIDPSGVLALAGDTQAGALELPAEVEGALRQAGASSVLDKAGGDEIRATFRPFASEAAARGALARGEIRAFYRLANDYLAAGRAQLFLPEDADWKEGGSLGSLERLLRDQLLAETVEPAVADRIRRPLARVEKLTITADGSAVPRRAGAQIAGMVVPIGFAMLLFIALAMSTGYLMQGTAAEKENKVVDVLLAAAGPNEILFGKLLGLGGAGLLQIAVWFGMIIFAAYWFATTIASFGVVVPWVALAVAPPFFAAAYFFTGSLILGTGSLGKNLKEVQQLGMVWSLASALPLMFISILISDPHGALGKVMTWIPFSAPVTVVLRLSLGAEGIAWWEVAGAFAVMVLATWLGLELGARLFRVGLLLSGSRPKWRALLRQARLGR